MVEQGSAGVAIVVGGAGGLGGAIVSSLAARGLVAVVADRAIDQASALAEKLDDAGLSAEAIEVDVTSEASVASMVERSAGLGTVQVLVNCAGFPVDRPLVKMTDEDWNVVLGVCLYGTFATCRAVAPLMIEAGYGRIVNLASRAYLGNPGQANYSAAKAGVVGLTKALAKELGRHSITCNAVAPGMIDTEMVRSHPKFDLIAERAVAGNSIKRLGSPDDVASTVAYLASPAAGFITGDVVHVSGGRFS